MLHGGPGFTDYMSMLAGEVAGWRAIRYQQRGFAPSALDGPFTVERHVADAIAVLDGLEVERVLVLGHSWGGHLALQLAVAAPDRVTGLVLADPLGASGPDGGYAEFGQGLIGRLPARILERLGELAERIGDRLPTDEEADEQLALIWPGYFGDPEQAPALPAGMRTSVAGNMQAMVSVTESLADGFPAALGGVTAPAVFVLGGQSPMPVSQGQLTAAMLPAAEAVLVPGGGHLPWHEHPGCVAAALATVRSRTGTG